MKRHRLKFPIELDIAGERMTFVGSDMLVGWFFQGFPDPMPGTDCWKQEAPAAQRALVAGMEEWHDQILCRGVWLSVEGEERVSGTPCRRLTPELVQRLGDQRGRAVLAYMSGIGWIRAEDPGHVAASTSMLPRGLRLQDPLADAERRSAMTRIPSKNLLAAIKQVADRAGTAAHVVWRRWWISEWLWTWRTQELERGARAGGAHGLPADFAHIGVEA